MWMRMRERVRERWKREIGKEKLARVYNKHRLDLHPFKLPNLTLTRLR